ncbi:hypothetical protein [Rhodoplanes sp. SY1]|uniref:hypothetical protein n=1 Tax=Rhodoplanes sp. SY1 TaxID=3166646 RepID=UPI0038B485AE
MLVSPARRGAPGSIGSGEHRGGRPPVNGAAIAGLRRVEDLDEKIWMIGHSGALRSSEPGIQRRHATLSGWIPGSALRAAPE